MKVYAYIHPELNNLCIALLPEAVPEGVEYIELEVSSIDDVIFDNGKIRLKTETEKLTEEKERKLAELKNYVASLLEETDYVVVRIAEAGIKGDAAEAERLRQKYAKQLQEREAIRQWNEQMKQTIRNAKTLEELRSIELNFTGFQKEV